MQDHTINQPRAASVIDAQGFELARINPGARTDTIRADQIFVDIYLGGATAEYVSDNGEHIVAQCPPNSFTFLPAGHAREVRRTRTGTAVQLLMGTNAVQQFSVHEGVNLARSEPLWHTFDHGMIGIATIISDHLRTAGDPIHPEIGKGYVRLILLRLAQIVARETVVGTTALPAAVQRAIEYVEAHHMEPVKLNDIASAAGLSPYHFSRVFRQAMDTSVHAYVTDRRIAIAQDLMQHSDLALSEIAYRVGFGSQSHMTTVFKKLTGRTPGTWSAK
ncbi:MAG: AraC family transcriptional regulator, partial [Pseudomonadota bacterium]